MKPVVIVHGTWSRFHDWHYPGSPLWKALVAHGYQPIQFLWSGYCGGITDAVIVPRSDEMKGSLMLWQSEGEKLALWCKDKGLEAPDILTQSHGLQVGVFAACTGQKFDHFLSISGPVREDMAEYRKLARFNIKKWTQAVDPEDDMTIRLGEAMDGHFGWEYDLPEADHNIYATGQDHSGLVLDTKAWEPLGLWDALGRGV